MMWEVESWQKSSSARVGSVLKTGWIGVASVEVGTPDALQCGADKVAHCTLKWFAALWLENVRAGAVLQLFHNDQNWWPKI